MRTSTNDPKPRAMPEYQLADTILEMAEKWGVSIADPSSIEKIGSAMFNTFGEASIQFYKRIWKLYDPLCQDAEVEARYNQVAATKNRISFASFIYYANMVGIKRMEFLIIYNGDHMAIS